MTTKIKLKLAVFFSLLLLAAMFLGGAKGEGCGGFLGIGGGGAGTSSNGPEGNVDEVIDRVRDADRGFATFLQMCVGGGEGIVPIPDDFASEPGEQPYFKLFAKTPQGKVANKMLKLMDKVSKYSSHEAQNDDTCADAVPKGDPDFNTCSVVYGGVIEDQATRDCFDDENCSNGTINSLVDSFINSCDMSVSIIGACTAVSSPSYASRFDKEELEGDATFAFIEGGSNGGINHIVVSGGTISAQNWATLGTVKRTDTDSCLAYDPDESVESTTTNESTITKGAVYLGEAKINSTGGAVVVSFRVDDADEDGKLILTYRYPEVYPAGPDIYLPNGAEIALSECSINLDSNAPSIGVSATITADGEFVVDDSEAFFKNYPQQCEVDGCGSSDAYNGSDGMGMDDCDEDGNCPFGPMKDDEGCSLAQGGGNVDLKAVISGEVNNQTEGFVGLKDGILVIGGTSGGTPATVNADLICGDQQILNAEIEISGKVTVDATIAAELILIDQIKEDCYDECSKECDSDPTCEDECAVNNSCNDPFIPSSFESIANSMYVPAHSEEPPALATATVELENLQASVLFELGGENNYISIRRAFSIQRGRLSLEGNAMTCEYFSRESDASPEFTIVADINDHTATIEGADGEQLDVAVEPSSDGMCTRFEIGDEAKDVCDEGSEL